MPRILAIDWDRHEARALLLSSGPTGVSVTGAWSVSLDRASGPASGQQIGVRLAAAVASQITGKVTTLVGVGRDNVQMQLLALPPAPADELPELVRFQAEREFTSLGPDAALDFIALAGDAQSPHQVLAVALKAAGVAEARDVGRAMGHEPDRIPLRACAAAAFVEHAGVVAADHVALVVNPLSDEADLTVLAHEKIVLMRTVRIPDASQIAARRRALVGEIRRTMAAVRQQLTDQKINQVVVSGHGESASDESTLSAELDIPVTVVDPVAHAPAGLDAQGLSSDTLARFTAVLGMALVEADRRPHVVDFANVRRPRAAQRFSRVHALAATAAAVAALWFAAYLWHQMSGPTRALAALERRIEDLQAQAKMYDEVTRQAAAVERWLATDVNWLDELEQFARRVRPKPLSAADFPADSDVVVTQLTMFRPPGADAAGGRINLEAKAKSDAAVRDLEQRLADARHRVTPGGVRRDDSVPGYPRALDLQFDVLPPDAANEADMAAVEDAP